MAVTTIFKGSNACEVLAAKSFKLLPKSRQVGKLSPLGGGSSSSSSCCKT
jgi:hypothetical protein